MNEDCFNEFGFMWFRFFEGFFGVGGDDDIVFIVFVFEWFDIFNWFYFGYGCGFFSMIFFIFEIMFNDFVFVVDDNIFDFGGKYGFIFFVVVFGLFIDDGIYIFKFCIFLGRIYRF